jgi:hypothetical protein
MAMFEDVSSVTAAKNLVRLTFLDSTTPSALTPCRWNDASQDRPPYQTSYPPPLFDHPSWSGSGRYLSDNMKRMQRERTGRNPGWLAARYPRVDQRPLLRSRRRAHPAQKTRFLEVFSWCFMR